jgi:hypothetical protein
MNVPDDVREAMARAIYSANPLGSWNNRVDPMRFDPFTWGDLSDEEQSVFLKMADAALSALEAAGFEVNRKGTLEALEPFASFAEFAVNENGWIDSYGREQISTWFGPSDFRAAMLTASRHKEKQDV